MKLILGAIAAGTLDPVAAADLAERCNASEDLREGLRARREGRSPDFRGR
jgi:hypothetical protein